MSIERLELDYVARPRRATWLGLFVLAAAIAVAAEVALRYRDVQDERARIEVATGLLIGERRPPRALPKQRLEEETKAAQAVMRRLTLPWAPLVQAIEAAATPDVAILQLQPDPQQRVLRLTGEARDQDAMLEYLQRLAEAKVLTDVQLVNHQILVDESQRPVRFAVQAALREAP
jgi:Tfp pilus assembly protein PilN